MTTEPPIPVGLYDRASKASAFKQTNTVDLMARQFPLIAWTIQDLVADGLTILVGRQKLGKTWLALDWAIAVATGGHAMGSIACTEGDVLYIDLENGPRRMQRRLQELLPQERLGQNISRLNWVNEAGLIGPDFLVALDDWYSTVADPRMVIIDVFQRVRPRPAPNVNAYESDYAALAPLQKWATDKRVSVVALHHTKKGGADDPLEALNGSNGLAACADSVIVLDKDANGITLYVRGRDVEEKSLAMSFLAGHWTVTGEASIVHVSKERGNILAALQEASEPMSPTDIANVTGMKNGNVRRLLFSLSKAGDIEKAGRAAYVLATRASGQGPYQGDR